MPRRLHYYGNGLGRILGSRNVGCNGSHDDVDLKSDKIGSEIRKSIVSAICISEFNTNVLSVKPSEVSETLVECSVPDRSIVGSER
jgi:hypothetical protein